MRNVFFVSDTHFGHRGMVDGRLTRADGVTTVRPFASVEEMDDTMVERWNSKVRPEDKVYHLGDVAMNPKRVPTVARLNGHKTLILGNHDIFDVNLYLAHFKNIRATRVFDGFVCSHVPIHPESLGRFGFNVHGHTHTNCLPDSRYVNICVEQTDYYPLELSELRVRIGG